MMQSWLRVALSLCAIIMLSMAALPQEIRAFRPPFILLYVLYWHFLSDRSFSILVLFFLGVCVDAFSVSLLGEHAFALVFTFCYANNKRRRFETSSVPQQLYLIMCLCFIYQSILQLIELIAGNHPPWWSALLTAVIGAWFWPLICFWLGTGRTQFKRVRQTYL